MAITSANQLELLQTAEAVAREKMIDPSLVVEAMEESLARAAKSRYGSEMDIRVSIDRKTGRATFTRVRTVVTEEEVEKDYPEFSKRLKWSLIVNRIGKDQDIKVEPEEIKEHTATQLRAQMASYGLADLGDEQVEQYVMSMLQQREHVEKTRDAIMEEKLNSFFKSKVRIKDKKVTLEQFTS